MRSSAGRFGTRWPMARGSIEIDSRSTWYFKAPKSLRRGLTCPILSTGSGLNRNDCAILGVRAAQYSYRAGILATQFSRRRTSKQSPRLATGASPYRACASCKFLGAYGSRKTFAGREARSRTSQIVASSTGKTFVRPVCSPIARATLRTAWASSLTRKSVQLDRVRRDR